MPRIFVIPGHGAGDSGACGHGYQEQERVRALASAIKKYGGDDVLLADFSRNYYADGGINTLNIPKDYRIVELHMDSAAASAKGGHVIIQKGIGGADEYDRRLADLMLKWFPGRSNRIVERNDLANPARAAARGYNYRLVENGFITNSQDIRTFTDNLDEIAKGYCEVFNIMKRQPDRWNCSMYETNGCDAQKFAVEKHGEWFALRCLADGRYLDVEGGFKEKGTLVQVYTGNGSDAQLWKAVPVPGEWEFAAPVYLVPKCAPDLVLDISGAEDYNKARLNLWEPHGGSCQQWSILDLGDGVVTIVTNLGTHRAIDVEGGGR